MQVVNRFQLTHSLTPTPIYTHTTTTTRQPIMPVTNTSLVSFVVEVVGNISKTSKAGTVMALGVDMMSLKRVVNLLLTGSERKVTLSVFYRQIYCANLYLTRQTSSDHGISAR